MLFNKKNKDYNYFKIFLSVFTAISCSIVVYFLFSKFNYISAFFAKLLKILMPVIIGIVFAYLLNPIISKIEKYFEKYEKINSKKKLARVLGIIVTYLILVLLVVILVRFFIPSLLDSLNIMIKSIPKYFENIFDYIKGVCAKYNINSHFIDVYRADINTKIKDSVVPNIDVIINNLATGITSVIRTIINLVVSVIISVYLIYDKEEFAQGIDNILKAYCNTKTQSKIEESFNYFHRVFGGFMVAKLIDSLIIGVITFVLLTIFKIPYALLISFVVCITNVIPFFGPFIGAIPSIVLLLLVNPTKALVFGIIILIIQQFDGNILGPKLIGDKIGIKSFWVLFAILLFGGLFGFVGMILAVPLFACIRQLIKTDMNERLEEKRKQEELEKEKRKPRGLRARLSKKESL